MEISNKDVNCPYCGACQDICHDDGHGYEEGVKHIEECIKCKKQFIFETSIIFYYEAYAADCLNDGNHNFVPTHTYPIEFTEMECCVCGEKRNCTESEMANILKK